MEVVPGQMYKLKDGMIVFCMREAPSCPDLFIGEVVVPGRSGDGWKQADHPSIPVNYIPKYTGKYWHFVAIECVEHIICEPEYSIF